MLRHAITRAPRDSIEVYSSRPEREPPRNEQGVIVCLHAACRDKDETFPRPCDWNRHMDKHERPFKCNRSTCEQNPGFTYSGGLLRHMREVHGEGADAARRPLYCPYTNCNRSTGEGFTRKENLEEHVRRRHSGGPSLAATPRSRDSNDEETDDRPLPHSGTVGSGSSETMRSVSGTELDTPSAQGVAPDSYPTAIERHDCLLGDGSDSELGRGEIIKKLDLARERICEQRKILEQKDVRLEAQAMELRRLRMTLGPDANAS